jgi:putative SOS response-associated peptidase YedK
VFCGRDIWPVGQTTFETRHSRIVEALLHGLRGAARNLQAHYNIAPTDTVDVVRPVNGATELVRMRWGAHSLWWKKPLKQLPATFNAREHNPTRTDRLAAYQRSRAAETAARDDVAWVIERWSAARSKRATSPFVAICARSESA